jgi:hypothetical protein
VEIGCRKLTEDRYVAEQLVGGARGDGHEVAELITPRSATDALVARYESDVLRGAPACRDGSRPCFGDHAWHEG